MVQKVEGDETFTVTETIRNIKIHVGAHKYPHWVT